MKRRRSMCGIPRARCGLACDDRRSEFFRAITVRRGTRRPPRRVVPHSPFPLSPPTPHTARCGTLALHPDRSPPMRTVLAACALTVALPACPFAASAPQAGPEAAAADARGALGEDVYHD